jgi:hypothetical protein
LVFVAAMLAGMKLFDLLERRQASARGATATASAAGDGTPAAGGRR